MVFGITIWKLRASTESFRVKKPEEKLAELGRQLLQVTATGLTHASVGHACTQAEANAQPHPHYEGPFNAKTQN